VATHIFVFFSCHTCTRLEFTVFVAVVPVLNLPTQVPVVQVEARLRQLEGRQLGDEAAKPRGLPGAEKYEAARQTGNGALLGQAKAYNADADVAMAVANGDKKEKKKKKVQLLNELGYAGLL
jgi:hypothetical protein